MIGSESLQNEVPEGLELLEVPKLTWAIFNSIGEKPDNKIIQNLWRRIYSEWFPTCEFEQAEGPCIEKNFFGDSEELGYKCEVWIPVKTKTRK